MRKVVFATAVALAFSTAAWAGPKDKTSQTLVNPDSIAGSADWDNTAISTKEKSGKCKIQIQAKGATNLINEKVICIADGDVLASSLPGGMGGNSVVLAGSFDDKGKLKIKGNLGAIGCGIQANALALNGGTTCYKQDIATYDWATACSNAGMFAVSINFLPGTEDVKPGAVVGLCQGINGAFGQRIDPPAGAVLSVQGSYQPLL